jgi:cobalt-zinc-cadmium efflux system outer membrane protein
MSFPRWARLRAHWPLAVFALACAPPVFAQTAGAPVSADAASRGEPARAPLNLARAIERVIATHPDLKTFTYTEQGLRAAADLAAQAPPLAVGGSVQKDFGSAGGNGLQFSLALASVLERGGKREARQALAASRIDALANVREAKRLDLLAEVARRYLDVVAAQAQEKIAAADQAQRERSVVAATHRVQAGASPESVKLMAEAMVARARLDQDRARAEAAAAYRRLAVLWGEREPVGRVAQGDPLILPEVPGFETLAGFLERTPELRRFADESRIREARVQLARSARAADINWQVGVGRLQEGSNFGVIGTVSVPLGAARRAEPEIRQAQAELEALSLEREAGEMSLYATLAQAHGQIVSARTEVERSRDDVLPRLARAEAAAERAYRAGAISYLEWAQVQAETSNVRRQQLAAAVEAQRALIEIQRLTGQSFVAADANRTEGTLP